MDLYHSCDFNTATGIVKLGRIQIFLSGEKKFKGHGVALRCLGQ